MSKYWWRIDEDFLDGDNENSEVGTEGPYDGDFQNFDNEQGFTLYDDDDNPYYHGYMYGDWYGFEPVDDFGMPNAGAVHIKLDGDEDYL